MSLIALCLCALAQDPHQDPGSDAIPEAVAQHLFVATQGGVLEVLDLEQGQPRALVARAQVGEPLQFLALHATKPLVHALGNERLSAYRWDAQERSLVLLGSGAVGARGTHVALSADGGFAVVASYGGAAVVLLPLDADGIPGDAIQTLGGAGDATFAKAHQVRVHAASGALHVPCLGADHVATLHLDTDARRLTLIGTAATPPGAGPRHLDYHPSLPRAYVLNELASSVTEFALDPGDGQLRPLHTTTCLPWDCTEPGSRSSDVHVAPGGRYLFTVNREPLNDIVTHAIDAAGRLRAVSRTSTGGVHARTFAVDPGGAWVWVANTRSREVVSLRVGHRTGRGAELERMPGAWRTESDISCVLAR